MQGLATGVGGPGLGKLFGDVAGLKNAETSLKGIGAASATAATDVALLSTAFSRLMPVVTAVAGVTSVFAGLGKAISSAAKSEETVFQFRNVAGASQETEEAIANLRKTGKDTATSFSENANIAKGFVEVGMSAKQAADMVRQLQTVHRMTGTSAEELGDIFQRAYLKQDLSMKDLAKVRAVPGIAAIAEQFKALEHQTQDFDIANKEFNENLSKEAENTHRAFAEEAEGMQTAFEHENRELEHTQQRASAAADAIAAVGEQSGMAKRMLDNFKVTGQFADPFSGMSPIAGKLGGQMAVGFEQLTRELGVSGQELTNMIQQGMVGAQDLLQAARRRREEQQQLAREQLQEKHRLEEIELRERERAYDLKIAEERFKMQQQLLQQQKQVMEQQRDLMQQVATALQNAFDPKALEGYFDTFDGKMEELGNKVNALFKTIGDPLLKALDPLIDAVNDKLMPVLQTAAENFGKWMNKVIPDFQTDLNKGLADVVDGFATLFTKAITAALDQVFTNLIPNLFKELERQVTDPSFWFGGYKPPGKETPTTTQPGDMPNTEGEVPFRSYSQTNQDQLDGIKDSLDQGNRLTDALNSKFDKVFQIA